MATADTINLNNVGLNTLGLLPLTSFSGSLLVDYATGLVTGSLQVAPALGIDLTTYSNFTITPGIGNTYTITGTGQTAGLLASTITIQYTGQAPTAVNTQYYLIGVELAAGTNGNVTSAASHVPSVIPETGSVLAGMTLNATAANGALHGDTDPQNLTLRVSSVTKGAITNTIASGGSTTITGSYGTLTLRSDGSYSYAATNGLAIVTAANGSPINDVFSFNVSDGTYSSTSSLTVTTSLGANGVETVVNASGNSTYSIGATTLTLNQTAASTYSGTIQDGSSGNVGGKVVVAGTGTLTLANNSTYTGGTMIASGTVIESGVGGALSSGPVVIAAGATLNLLNNSLVNVNVQGTTFSGAGTIQKTGGGNESFGGNNGTVTVALAQGGLLDVEGGTLFADNNNQGSFAGNMGSLKIAAGAVFNGQNGAIQVDALTGAGSLQGGLLGIGTTTIGVAGGSGTFSGTIQDALGGQLALIKTGAGTEVLTGTNTFTGGTILAGGTLELGSAGASGSLVLGAPGSGSIAFSGTPATLQIDAAALTGTTYTAAITGLTFGTILDLRGLTYASDDQATLVGSTLTVGDANGTKTFTNVAFANGVNTAYESFAVASDGLGGTVLSLSVNAPSTPALTAGQDTGVSSTDGVTSVNVPTFSGTALPGGTVTLFDGATVIGTAAVALSGAYTVTASHALTDGQHQIGVTVNDGSGHVSTESALTSLTIDTTAPTAPAAPSLMNDTGASISDGITTNATIVYATPVGSDVLLYKVNAGTYSTTAPSFTSDGTYTVSTEERDLAGNVSAASSLTFTLDTAAPTAPIAPTLASDTGISTTDHITSDAAITYATPVGSDVLLYKVGTAPYSTTAPSFTADGTYTVSTEERDLAGNVSAASSLTFTLDTTAPAAPTAPMLVSDTGTWTTDNITSNAAITYATPVGSDILLYKVGNSAYSTTAPSITADGTYTVSTEERDTAGNVSAASSLTFTLDTTAPIAPAAPTLATDTGVAGDNISSNATINYATPIGSDVLLYKVGNGTYSTTVPSFTVDGTYTLSTEERDAAGNVSGPSSLTFTLDTTAPIAPAAPTLAADTGVASDNITSNAAINYATPIGSDILLYKVGNGAYSSTAPTFTNDGTYTVFTEEQDLAGNVSAASSLTFTLDTTAPATPAAPFLTDDTSGGSRNTSDPAITYATPASGDTLVYQVDNTGAFTTTRPTFLTDGSQDGLHTVSVEEQDAAGNRSAASSLTFTLDTGAGGGPAIPVAPTLTNDTSGGQNITSDPRITYAAPASGDTLYYKVGSGGTYSTTAPTFLTNGSQDGTYTVFVEQRTAANVSSAASTLTFTLDTQAPIVPGAPTLTHDTSGGSNITSDASINYVTPATGDTLVYNLDNVGYSTTRPTITGDGTHTIAIEERDAAGNTSAASSLTFMLDTATPSALAAPTLAHDTSGGRNITNDPTINYAAATAGDMVLYRLDGAATYSSTAPTFATNGTQDGVHTVSVEQKDAAGNVSAASSLTFTLATATPATLAAPMLTHDTSGGSGVTSDPTITYAAAATGDTLFYSVDNGSYTTALPTFATNGTQEGSHTVSVEQRDAAGNSSASSSVTFTLDTQAPTAPTAPVLADDTSGGQKVTRDPAITYATPAAGDTLLYRVDGATTYTTTVPTFATNGTQDGPHTVSVEEKDAAGNISTASSLTFTLDTITPVVTASGPGGGYHSNIGPTVVNASVDVTDPSGSTLQSAMVVIATGLQAGDVLAANTAGTSISAAYSANTGTLTLTGADTAADYQQVLRSVTYTSSSNNPTIGGTDASRTVTFSASAGPSNMSAPVSTSITVDQAPVAPPTAPAQPTAPSFNYVGTGGTSGTGALRGASDSDNGSLSITQVNGSSANVGVSTQGTYGHLTLNADGSESYLADQGLAIVSAADGTPITDAFSYVVSDSGGSSTTSSDTFTISLIAGGLEAVTNLSDLSATARALSLGATRMNVTQTIAGTYSGVIQNGSSGNVGGILSVAGTAALTLTGVNTYTGKTSVSGILDLGAGSSIAASKDVKMIAGGVFDISGDNQLNGVTIAKLKGPAGTVQLGNKTLVLNTPSAGEFDGTITDGGASGGTGGVLKIAGTAAMMLGGVNTYTGKTAISGILQLGANASIATSKDVKMVAGGVFDISADNQVNGVTINKLKGPGGTVQLGGKTLVLNTPSAGEFDGVITDGGAAGGTHGVLKIAGTGAMMLGGVNTYTGKTAVSGILQLAAGSSIAASKNVKMVAGGVFDISADTGGATIAKLKGPGGTVELGSQTLTLNTPTAGEFDGTIADGGVAGGTGGVLNLTGPSAMLFTGNSSYTGGTILSGGTTLELGGLNAAGSGTITFNGAATLKIDAPALTAVSSAQSTFGNTVTGFGTNDTLDLTSLKYSPGTSTATVNNGVLTATSGTNSVSLNLAGVTSGTQFTTSADATGGTLITQAPLTQAFVYQPAANPGASQVATPSGDLAPSAATALAEAMNMPSSSSASTYVPPTPASTTPTLAASHA